jgi:hypothetical protein
MNRWGRALHRSRCHMQFAMRYIVPDFLLRYPKVNVVAHATILRSFFPTPKGFGGATPQPPALPTALFDALLPPNIG